MTGFPAWTDRISKLFCWGLMLVLTLPVSQTLAGDTSALFRTGYLYQPNIIPMPVPGCPDQSPAVFYGKEDFSGAGLRKDISIFSVETVVSVIRIRRRALLKDVSNCGQPVATLFRNISIDTLAGELEAFIRVPTTFILRPMIGAGVGYHLISTNDRVGGFDKKYKDGVLSFSWSVGADFKTSEKTRLMIMLGHHTLMLETNDDAQIDNGAESVLNQNIYYAGVAKNPGWTLPKKIKYRTFTVALVVGFR